MRIPTNNSKRHLPNWLDKLRKVKGFPSVKEGQVLDHFLSEQPLQQQLHEQNDANDLHLVVENDDVSNRMASMLSDLFSDGRSGCSARRSNFKARRKQPSPRICILPVSTTAAGVTEDRGSNESDRIVVFDDDVILESKRKGKKGLREEEGRKLGECDLVGYSRTEVTVIDSSNPLWKFDKYLFRKKNVWKARDCRSVARYDENNGNVGIGRKKKRGGVSDDDDDNGIVVSKISKSFGGRK